MQTTETADALAGLTAFPPLWAGGWGEDRGRRFAQVVVGGVLIELVWMDPGTFFMGSPEDEEGRYNDEQRHEVRLTRGFWIGRYPVTQAQWQAVAGAHPTETSQSAEPDLPVAQVTWDEVTAFAEKLNGLLQESEVLPPGFGFRLPTEAEWEYACRAGTDSAFHDGSACTKPEGKDPALDRLGWFDENSGKKTHPVGQKQPNAWGLHDCHGNVFEWCADLADLKDNVVVSDAYPAQGVDPVGTQGARRVVRGGRAWNSARICRSAYRDAHVPGDRYIDLGFRLAAGLKTSQGAERPGAAGREAGVAERPAGRPAA
jgi:formylglycine-generating enzyme required for sulfatase activity